MAQIIDGKLVASEVKNRVRKEIEEKGIKATLAVIIVGNNNASRVYVDNKKKDCAEVGIKSVEYAMGEETTQEELLDLINKLNLDDEVNGILVQLPLPKHIDEKTVLRAILPSKDVDAFHPYNVGLIMIGEYSFLPCTPAGVMELLDYYNIEISGKKCVVLGRSNIVGKPMSMLMLHKNATVTIAHSKTKNLDQVLKEADILIVAVGVAKLVKANMVKEGAVVIDVGMNRNENGKLCGDVDYDEVSKIASYITPVPGGVGPMTRAILLKNTLTAANKH